MNSLFAAAARAMPSAFALGAWGARGFHSTGMLMGKFSKNQGKNVALSSKRAKKGYYKGKGCRTLGRHLKNSECPLARRPQPTCAKLSATFAC